MPTATMNLGVIVDPYGNHPAAWLVEDAPLGAEVNIAHYIKVAKIAEGGSLDFVFFADVPAIRDGNMDAISRWPLYAAQFEPITLLGALATATSKIGLAATVSTSFWEPYNVARQFASLDHLSHGRVGWNVVTTSQPAAAFNFGGTPRGEHAQRYARAKEFIDVVLGLWRSWDDDAFLHDRAAARFFDADKVQQLNHSGPFFSVRGPLNVPRTPQGHPVMIQAGGSEPGKELAAETAEIVFTGERTIERARAFYADVKGRMAKFGRAQEDMKILSGLNAIVGRTRAEAEDKLGMLRDKMHPDVGRELLSIDLDYVDLSDVPLDAPFPPSKLPQGTEGGKSYLGSIQSLVKEDGLTLRQLYQRYATGRGGNVIVGSPTDVADLMEEWFTTSAADGFMIGLSSLPSGLSDFVKLVVPELRRRHLFREMYDGLTLRHHLGLKRPVNHVAAR